MSPDTHQMKIDVLDVSQFSYCERVSAAALQGLVNRNGPTIFVDYGIYDDPLARRTNEDFMADDIWFGKYRNLLGAQDQRNLAYYQQEHGAKTQQVKDLAALVHKYHTTLKGCVVWDAALDDTANIALMLAAQEDLLPIEASQLEWSQQFDLPIARDLRGRWNDRVSLYRWVYENLFAQCKPGQVACIEPAWQRPEFLDYLVQNKIFTYNLGSKQEGLGGTLLLLLAFGPAWLRELIFTLRLDKPLRSLALKSLSNSSAEIRLNNRIQRSVKAAPYPTLFGWHTKRDDELTFMLLLSANGLRLVPSHLAANFSFHSQVKPLAAFESPVQRPKPKLDPQGIYITYTLSDGDQLMMMSTAELGNWYTPRRGELPFNWETQPLLCELAPALLEKFIRSATDTDCLVAGPSGAGYIVPPLAPNLPAYMKESGRICQKAGIRVVTSYVADPPRRVLAEITKFGHGLQGFLAGYGVLSRTLHAVNNGIPFISNQIPTVDQIWATPEELFETIQKLASQPGSTPRFIGVHFFAYRTTYDDVVRLSATLTNEHIHIVRADDFLVLAAQVHPS
jgi:hypothetical protein